MEGVMAEDTTRSSSSEPLALGGSSGQSSAPAGTNGNNHNNMNGSNTSTLDGTTSPQQEATEASSSQQHHHEVTHLGDVYHVDDNMNGGNDNNADDAAIRLGTTSSARFNILSTMVGGGCLSLPYAFSKSGNVLVGPLMLIAIASLSEYCFRIIVQAIRKRSYGNRYHVTLATTTKVGSDSFESMAAAAFGPKAYLFSTTLVTAMCFFGTVGYAVLLRDMLEPITVAIHGPTPPGPSWENNLSLWCVVLGVTPLCTLQTLTSLKRFGAASMLSVLILGCCILYRSLQCNLLLEPNPNNHDWSHWTDSFRFWPETSLRDVLNVFPLYISCYVCHYNILTVHNEFRQPTVARVQWWLRSTTWVATAFYMMMGVAGSAYGAKCTASGEVSPNVLLSFSNDDPLLLVGRMCLAITITLAFPMLTIPARDILLRSLHSWNNKGPTTTTTTTAEASAPTTATPTTTPSTNGSTQEALQEPLLPPSTDEEQPQGGAQQQQQPTNDNDNVAISSFSYWERLSVAMVLFYAAAAVASIVQGIDVVWDLLGSSLSILLSVLIPAASFLVLTNPDRRQEQAAESAAPTPQSEQQQQQQSTTTTIPQDEPAQEESTMDVVMHQFSRLVAWTLVGLFVPLMFLSTGNAVYHTFFEKQ